jgi:two-component system, OmpR family, response regulator RegX3
VDVTEGTRRLHATHFEADKMARLELGADDYLTKPFSMRELVSRVRAQLRRAGMATPSAPVELLTGGPVEMDVERHEVRIRGREVALPPKEFVLLEAFLLRRGRLLTRDHLITEVRGRTTSGTRRPWTSTSSDSGGSSRTIPIIR